MSVVEGRADIEDLLLEVSFNRNWAPLQTFGVGGGQFSGAMRMRTGGPGSYANFSVFLKQKTHFWDRKLQEEQCDVRCWENSGKHLLVLSFSGFDAVDGCAGRPAKGRRWKSVTVKV